MAARIGRGDRGGRGGRGRGRGGLEPAPTPSGPSGKPPATTTTGGKTILTEKTEFKVVLAVKEIQRLLQEVTQEEIEMLVEKTESISQAKIDPLKYLIFEFQGMNPVLIICKFVILAKYHKYKDTPTPEEEQELTDADVSKVTEDIMFCIAANIYMGNLSGKALLRRSQEGKDKVSELAAKYMMEYGSTGANLAADTITFPRVSASFPALATRMSNVLPTKDFPKGEYLSISLPKPMRISAFASFISTSLPARTRNFLKLAVASYSCDQSMTFVKTLSAKEAFDAQWTFVEAASTSPVPEESVQQAMLLEYGIGDLFKTLNPIVVNAQAKAGTSYDLPTEDQYKADIAGFIVTKGKEVEQTGGVDLI